MSINRKFLTYLTREVLDDDLELTPMLLGTWYYFV